MTHRVFRTTLLVGIIVLLGCEEPPVAPGAPPPRQTPSYSAADLDGIKERWRALASFGGGGAQATLALPRAAAVAGSESFDIPGMTFEDARRYGACEVFSATYTPVPYPDSPIYQFTVLDCVDWEEQESGHYHAASFCSVLTRRHPSDLTPLGTRWFFPIVRAGDSDRRIPEQTVELPPSAFGQPGPPGECPPGEQCSQPEPAGLHVILHHPPTVLVTINGLQREMLFHAYETDYYSDGVYPLKWAYETINVSRGGPHDLLLDTASGGEGSMTFSISYSPTWTWVAIEDSDPPGYRLRIDSPDPSQAKDLISHSGTVEIQDNDADAVIEYERRCATL